MESNERKDRTVSYGELKAGDVVWFYGARVRIVDVRVEGMSDYYEGERVIRFDIEPYDEECVRTLGKFYSHGTYGGVEHLALSRV